MFLRRKFQHAPIFGLLTILALGANTGSARAANQAGSPTAAARIAGGIEEGNLVRLAGQTHPLAQRKYDQGAVSDSFPMQHMFLQLRRSPDQDKALEKVIDEIQDEHSSHYHQWLTADEIGTVFGPAQSDIETVTRWLSLHGFQVNQVYKNGLTIDVSGTAGQVREAFHTEIHKYAIKGVQHIANAGDPQIPAALAPVVAGFVALHDFKPRPLLNRPVKNFTNPCAGCPDGFGGIVQYDEAPADLATIYNVTPLYTAKAPITGKGQTVVVLEDTDIQSADVAKFRSSFGLSKYSGTFSQVHPGAGCGDPGTNGAEGEAALDAEWAGAVAPDATVKLASCADTATNFGAFIAAQNLLDSANPPQIMSLSYAECEATNGPGPNGNGYVNALWQQAAGEGVSIFVSAGDGAAAGCDNFDTQAYSTAGIAANGLASTPYDLAAGGTDFLDSAEGANSTYWAKSNTATGKSAKSYVPEMTWNDSCGSSVLFSYYGYANGVQFCNSNLGSNFLDITGGSGAPSFVYAKPSWQKNVVGMPNDGKRDLPDVSLFASNGFWSHSILFCMSDAAEGGVPCDYSNGTDTLFNSAGGTSFVAPQLASIQALINQKAGGRQGNAAVGYYKLSKAQFGGATNPDQERLGACNSTRGNDIGKSCIFYDVTAGSTAVPCYGTNSCYDPNGEQFGILSTSDTSLKPAFNTGTGWDFATGIGTINVTNVVDKWK
jgi:subtilase family serine protease